ncbi:hypothetical protein B0T22DRAFT_2970 [Podospora appendiculata]|uniref:Uncharacterized protein n=1 Tax=Podospora appendiculata TaxID=314037 RepID=A0AAE0XES6_9PEZI|nr:hypothetical protein B0T22DRAFT_2970 [Podospora appendiculata]
MGVGGWGRGGFFYRFFFTSFYSGYWCFSTVYLLYPFTYLPILSTLDHHAIPYLLHPLIYILSGQFRSCVCFLAFVVPWQVHKRVGLVSFLHKRHVGKIGCYMSLEEMERDERCSTAGVG